MPDYDVVNDVTVTKINMINELPGGCGTLRATAAVVAYLYCVHSY